MSRELKVMAYVTAALIAARALVLTIDAAVTRWRRRDLYGS